MSLGFLAPSGSMPYGQSGGISRASISYSRSPSTTCFAQAAVPSDTSSGSPPAIPATSQYAWLKSKRGSRPKAMMEELEFVTPPPVQMRSSPASFMRSSYSPRGNGSTRSSFCRSTHRCASPGLSSVNLPIWNIVTTTTLTGMGAARMGAARIGAAREGWGGAAPEDAGAKTPSAPKAKFNAAASAPSAPDLSVRVFNGIPLVSIPARRKKALVHRLVRENLLARKAIHLVREHQPLIGRTHIEVGSQIAAIARRLIIDGRNPNPLRRVAPAAAPQFGNDRLETAPRIEHIVDQQQLVFRVERGDQVVDGVHPNRAALLVDSGVR